MITDVKLNAVTSHCLLAGPQLIIKFLTKLLFSVELENLWPSRNSWCTAPNNPARPTIRNFGGEIYVPVKCFSFQNCVAIVYLLLFSFNNMLTECYKRKSSEFIAIM